METIEIKKENAVKAFNQADASGQQLLNNLFGEIFFTKKKKWNEIKSFEDACEALGLKPEEQRPFRSPATSRQEWINDLVMAEIICFAIKDGEQVDWSNSSEYKWWPWFEWNDKQSGFGFSFSHCNCSYSHSTVGSRLCFLSSELALYALKQFEALYIENQLIIK